jgi:HEAT repeat protein
MASSSSFDSAPPHERLAATQLDTQQRQDALLALLQTPDAVLHWALLAELLTNETEPLTLRCACALGLGRLATHYALEALQPLRHHADPTLRHYVIEALVTSQHPAVIPWLVAALYDTDNTVFAVAAQGLGQFGTQVVPSLRQVLDEAEAPADARCVAAWQLGEVGSREALPSLVHQAEYANHPDVQALCLWALGQLGQHTPEVLRVLQWGKQQPNPELRLRAETALKKVVRSVN